ncbi:cytochrome P450 [Sphingomonas sp. S2-65]|uniref:cytochrome P450 n=1 Tax=Sphingomonas sp. S2-65 TaxID=2903960 RepID=UPI001F25B52E|nr:cytochrome P450 [Sphingomonas sp. S2-65]UYY58421.1 cytochrome P450 [Sphingomonas sp. S2-65]
MHGTEKDAIDTSTFEQDLASLPIDSLDVAQPRLFQLGLAPRYFERLRREAPVHYCADGHYGAYWSVTRLADIEAVELDPATFSSDHANGGFTIASHQDQPQFLPSFLAMDPPRHTEQRKIVAPAFSPDRLGAMADQLRRWSADILDALPVNEPFDWVDRVSVELTARTLALLLGYPQERSRDLIRWSEAMVALVGTPAFPTLADKLRVMQECFTAFDAIWAERLQRPAGNDLISMLASQPETRDMAPTELHGTLLLLIVGGNDTTRNSITGSVVAFDRFPEQLERLRAQPGLIAGLTPELLRWQTPIAHMRRTATRDAKLGGRQIAKGDKVVLWYLAANRDDTMFEQADSFVLDRPNARRHLAFGAGIHRCVGARLAELQVRTLWEEILKRFPRIEVLQPPGRTFSTFIHGYTDLEVILPERRGG